MSGDGGVSGEGGVSGNGGVSGEGGVSGNGNANASCAECQRRSALLLKLQVTLDMRSRDVDRLWGSLQLDDDRLIAALGGSRREQLRSWHANLEPIREPPPGVSRLCRHSVRYPRSLAEHSLGPWELHAIGGERLAEILSSPLVAIMGTRRCTDYGMEIARTLASDLTAAGVSVIAELEEGISYGALAGLLGADGKGIAVSAAGVDRCTPRTCSDIHRRIGASGGVISELPCGTPPRRWAQLARARTLALLADLVIVVEASEHPRELACARLARTLGRRVGAVPGRVRSPTSRGPNALVKQGTPLICEAGDALDLLYGVEGWSAPPPPPPTDTASLDPRLRHMLERIAAGEDTLCKLSARGEGHDAVLVDLAELELLGLVVRGDGGRYLLASAGSQYVPG